MSINTTLADDLSIVRESFAAIEQGDMARLAACFTPDAVVWHNHDGVEQTIPQASAVLRYLYDVSNSVFYDEQTLNRAGNLVFSKHVLNAELKSGKRLKMHAMMQMQLNSDGYIERVDEYFDSRAIDVLEI